MYGYCIKKIVQEIHNKKFWEELIAYIPFNTRYVHIRCRGKMFTKSLPINDRLFWLHYSVFQVLCHISPSSRLLVLSTLQKYPLLLRG
jgi:hypothetical protein